MGIYRFMFIIAVILTIFVEQVSGTWWFISQLPLQAVGSGIICDNIPGLIGKQRRMCRLHQDAMVSLGKGALQGVNECQFQFKKHRWNCSTLDRDSSVFGKVLLKVGTREAAFVYSISSAGVVYSITRACSLGHLSTCACDPDKRGRGRDRYGQIFEWGGCSDDVNYGRRFARTFIDAKERKNMDARALMNLHNNRAGRQAVKRLRKLECKCHGISGSCAMRTCWRAMRDFRKVGNFLKKRYRGAIQVTMSQDARKTGLIVTSKHHKKPTKLDLVYFDESPDYCVKDLSLGSLGTEGRECDRHSLDTDGCDIMCCGRGYHSDRVRRTDKCECSLGTEGREYDRHSLDTDGCDILCCGRGYHSDRVRRTDKCECSLGTEGRECDRHSLDTDGCDIMCCGRGYHSDRVRRTDKCECSLGTEGRECDRHSLDTDGCDIMCCGRGYHSDRVRRTDKCECKFHWCCDVICKNCTRTVDRNTCKGPG